MIKIVKIKCPRCQQIRSVPANSGDYVHSCKSGNTTLDQEDVLVIGNWDDYTGSDNSVKPNVMQTAGRVNTLAGTEGELFGGEDEARTDRGKKAKLYRQRQHIEYIDDETIKNFEKKDR